MADMIRTSIGLRNVAVKSTPPHLMVMSVLVEVTYKGLRNLSEMRPKEPNGTHSHAFLNRRA